MKGDGLNWRRLGRIEQAFFIFAALYALLYFTGAGAGFQFLVLVAAFVSGVIALIRLARRAMRVAIWRLRNRLIVAYLFIAVVPVVLILLLMGVTFHAVIGQMAVYLVNTELNNRMRSLSFPADSIVNAGTNNRPFGLPPEGTAGVNVRVVRRPPGQAGPPVRGQQPSQNRFIPMVRRSFSEFEILTTGENPFRYPPDSKLTPPPPLWKNASGLITKKYGNKDLLYAWAHAEQNGNEVTILAPITHEFLNALVPGIGDVYFVGKTPRSPSKVPAAANVMDLTVGLPYPVDVPAWESPESPATRLLLIVDTRYSAVLGIVFGTKAEWSNVAMTVLLVLMGVFLVVELASLFAGIKVTRTITGAVHELYEGTQHVRQGNFAYRIPVKGDDQLADLSSSFNMMTQNLGQLIVVAKEKERLESELTIAREVQNQLFPKDVPFTKSLELKGVCNPARMVSGDYYDFMALPNDSLAFAIGDVAGKGISAALLMATIQSTMRTQLAAGNGDGPHRFSAAKLVATLNRQLYATTGPEKYATFYFAMYEEATHALTYTNAGHLAPILMRGSDLQMLDSTGTVVGAFPVAIYEEKVIQLERGDVLLAYTDGIVEPENVYGEMFGDERLKDLLIKYQKADSSELIARTMEAVVHWTGAGELQDDMTMVVARRL